jgi:hypothetical protein
VIGRIIFVFESHDNNVMTEQWRPLCAIDILLVMNGQFYVLSDIVMAQSTRWPGFTGKGVAGNEASGTGGEKNWLTNGSSLQEGGRHLKLLLCLRVAERRVKCRCLTLSLHLPSWRLCF